MWYAYDILPKILQICEKNNSTKAWGQVSLNLGLLYDDIEFILIFIIK